MKINYFFDEKIEFFESLLTKNGYWDFLAKKFYGKNLMNHPYKKNIIMFFENYKEDVVFTDLDKFCKSISDFSLLWEFPFCYKIENETLCINQNNKKTFTTNSNNNIECYDFLNKISDLLNRRIIEKLFNGKIKVFECKQYYTISFMTNGLIINNKIIKYLKSRVIKEIYVSLDGYKKIQDFQRKDLIG